MLLYQVIPCRYLAICRPFAIPRRHSKMTRAAWALSAIWIASVSFSLPWIYYNKVIHYYYIVYHNVYQKLLGITYYPVSAIVVAHRVKSKKKHIKLQISVNKR